tara:strand:+ start:924 stop:1811 length:888 start_codon:yes stop_codon:yes gene_type:complete
MKNILILGKTGMLGSMMFHHFSKLEDYKVFSTSRDETSESNLQFDVLNNSPSELSEFITKNKIDYVLNAIGILNAHCRDDNTEGIRKAILINSNFPFQLSNISKQTNAKVIQIATDCVYDGKEGNYNEDASHSPLDVYGKTKSLGEVNDNSLLNIRCSIIGPEKKAKLSLLEWFLTNEDKELNGFLHHKWNGVTTLRFAKLMHEIIKKDLFNTLLEKSHIHHYVPKYSTNKNDMLILFNKVFKKDFKINPTDSMGTPIDRTLSTKLTDLNEFADIDFEKDLDELNKIMEGGFYDN